MTQVTLMGSISAGAEVLEENIQIFFDSGLTPDMAFETPFSK